MIPAVQKKELSENSESLNDMVLIRRTLGKFERSKILEVYFARLDGRIPEEIPVELEDLYDIELPAIRTYLLGQHPQDTLMQKIFKMMH